MPISKKMNQFTTSQTNITIPRSRFDLTSEHRTTFSSGYWFPVFCKEVLPGDSFDCSFKALVRELSPAVPVMDNLLFDVAAFFVPSRLCCLHDDDFEKACGSDQPDAWEASYTKPDLISTGNYFEVNKLVIQKDSNNKPWQVAPMSLANYLGFPILTGENGPMTEEGVNAVTLPFLAVERIWNDWLRNENFAESIDLKRPVSEMMKDCTFSLADPKSSFLRSFKLKDYFTSALPAPQKGQSVLVPVGNSAPVSPGAIHSLKDSTAINLVNVGDNVLNDPILGVSGAFVGEGKPGAYSNQPLVAGYAVSDNNTHTGFEAEATDKVSVNNLWADLSAATGASVNQIRMSFALQRLEEKLARGGSRFKEYIKAIYGVDAPAGLLQMSEYIGGGTIDLSMNAVVQTSGTTSSNHLGTLGAYSNTFDDSIKFSKSFVEFGYLIVMATVRPRQSYSQGLPLMFSRFDPTIDYYSPTFAHIGEQPIFMREIMLDCLESGDGNLSSEVFGYKEAWAEYKTGSNTISGNLAPAARDLSLQSWTYTTNFEDGVHSLSKEFLQSDSGQIGKTLVDVSTVTQFMGDFVLDCVATRPMPVNSIPGLLDHF